MVALVAEEVPARGQQERAELPLLAIDPGQRPGLQQRGEEGLGQVLGRVRVVVVAADVGVDRLPVRLAEHGQRVLGAGLVAVAGGEDQAPVGGLEGVGRGHAMSWIRRLADPIVSRSRSPQERPANSA